MAQLRELGAAGILLLVFVAAGCVGSDAKPASRGPASLDEANSAHVAGKVRDPEQLPVPNATVSLLAAKNLVPVGNSTTGPDGRFDLGRVAIGDYVVSAQALGFEVGTRALRVLAGQDELEVSIALAPVPVAEPYSETVPGKIIIQYGLAYQVGGDFNQGCIYEGVTCQAAAYPDPNIHFNVQDPKQARLATIVVEESWTSTSPVCAKTMALDIYNPDAPNTADPKFSNPHYWTNYPSQKWKIQSPVVIVIPRNESGNADAIDDASRMEKNYGDPLTVRGNWTLRHFPPGRGLTNLPADLNCFTDQQFNIYWTSFYLDPAPIGFSARPQ